MPGKFDLSVVLDVPKLSTYLKRVEGAMNAALGTERSELTDAVVRLTKVRGKRLRPTLVIASALLSGNEIDNSVIVSAAAVELIHIGSLVHDDIIDKAPTRWDVPTIHAQEGLDLAILGGDFLFAKACMLAGMVSQEAGILAAETITQLCQGQSAELGAQYDLGRTEAQLERAIRGKTAVLLAAACRIGGICSMRSHDELEALSSFGTNFGMSFQLIDDVLDFISTDKQMGKPVGNDIKEGVYGLPLILSLKGPKRAFIEKELAKNSPSALTKLLLENGTIDKTLARAKAYNRSAEQALEVFGRRAQNLAKLPHVYTEWALTNLVAPEFKAKINR